MPHTEWRLPLLSSHVVILQRLLTLTAALLAVMAASVATAVASSAMAVWAVFAGIALLAGLRPGVAVLIVAAFAPLGGAIGPLSGLRSSSTDPLILSAVAGWLVGRTVRPAGWDRASASLAGLLALTVGTSLAVQCGVEYQVAAPDGLTLPGALVQWATGARETAWRSFRPDMAAALRLLAGCGIFAMAVEVCRRDWATAGSAIRLLTLGVAAVALLNVNRFAEVALRQGTDLMPAAARLHAFLRVSATIPDLNAAGALFALVLPVAAALWMHATARRWVWGAAVGIVGAGLWLSGSRAAMAGCAASAFGWLALAQVRWSRARTVGVLTAVLAAVAVLVVWYPRAGAHTPARDAWVIRQELARAGIQMAREAPVFGVGVGRFPRESARLASPVLRQYGYASQNAHNQFIQVLGELGIVGAGLLAGLIACGLAPGGQAPGALRGGVRLGLAAFLAASLLMHPLLMTDVAAVFWLALGLARSAVAAPAVEASWPRRLLPALVALLLVASVPARIRMSRHALDLDGMGIGLSVWRTDPGDDRRYRVASGDAVIYIDARAQRLRVPLRARGSGKTDLNVTLWLDGRLAGRARVEVGRWSDLAMVLPPRPRDGTRFRRLEFRWVPESPDSRLEIGRETVFPHAPGSVGRIETGGAWRDRGAIVDNHRASPPIQS